MCVCDSDNYRLFPLLDLYQTITSPTAEIVTETPILSWELRPLLSPQNTSTKTRPPHHQPRSGTLRRSSRRPLTLDAPCTTPRVWVTTISVGFPYPTPNMSGITTLKSWKRDLGKRTVWINIPPSGPVVSLNRTLSWQSWKNPPRAS